MLSVFSHSTAFPTSRYGACDQQEVLQPVYSVPFRFRALGILPKYPQHFLGCCTRNVYSQWSAGLDTLYALHLSRGMPGIVQVVGCNGRNSAHCFVQVFKERKPANYGRNIYSGNILTRMVRFKEYCEDFRRRLMVRLLVGLNIPPVAAPIVSHH